MAVDFFENSLDAQLLAVEVHLGAVLWIAVARSVNTFGRPLKGGGRTTY